MVNKVLMPGKFGKVKPNRPWAEDIPLCVWPDRTRRKIQDTSFT
jgi:hypothetical protein